MTQETREQLLERAVDELMIERDYLRHLLDEVYRTVEGGAEARRSSRTEKATSAMQQ